MAQNGALPTIAVSRAMLATARGRRKLDLILESPNAQAFVRQLPAEDLYFAIKEIGLADAREIVGLASPNQFRAFVDLDGWNEGLPDARRMLEWLQVALDGSKDDKAFRAKRNALDPEILLLLLKAHTIVHSLEENDDPVLMSSNFISTAERKYIIEIPDTGESGMTMRRLIEDYIDENPFEATRLFEAVRWESATELEETALRWRTGRLRDMGFPEMEEAIRIWAPLPAGWKPEEAGAEPGPVAGVPALLLTSSRHATFLDRVSERLSDETRPYFNEGLIYLLNCAIVADGADPKEIDQARETLVSTRDMLSLGLELASGGSEDVALAILGSTPATELFRLAVTRIAALGREAATAARAVSFGTAGATSLDSPDQEILSGLRRKRPRLYDPPPVEQQPRVSSWHAYRDREDLAKTEAAILRARAAGAVLAALKLDMQEVNRLAEAAGRAPAAVTFTQLFLTAALHSVDGRAEVLGASDLAGLCHLFSGGKLTAEARESLRGFTQAAGSGMADELRPALDAVTGRAVARLEDELGPPCAAGGLDPRFVECLLVGQG